MFVYITSLKFGQTMKFNVNIYAIIGTIAVLLVTAGVICYKKLIPEGKNCNLVPKGHQQIGDEPGSTKSVAKNDLENLVPITELLNMQESSSIEMPLYSKVESLNTSERKFSPKFGSKQPFVSTQPVVSSPPVEQQKSNDLIEGDQPFSYLVADYLNSTNKESGNGGKSGEVVKLGQNGKRKRESFTSSLASSEKSIMIVSPSSTSSNEEDHILTIYDSSTNPSINSGYEGFVKVPKSDKETQTPILSGGSFTSINFDGSKVVSAAELSLSSIVSIQSMNLTVTNTSTDGTIKPKEAEEKSDKYITVDDEIGDKNLKNTLKKKENQTSAGQTSDEEDEEQSNEQSNEQGSNEDGETAESSSKPGEDNSNNPEFLTKFGRFLHLW